MCLVKIHGEEMLGDVESIGAEGGVADMDKIDEIQQLTQLLGVEQATGDAKDVIDSSSDYRPGNSGGSWERRSWKMF
jgi:hypothetical protein